MPTAILVIILLAACSGDRQPEPMLRGDCIDRVVSNLFGPGDVSYRECRWQEQVWACRLEATQAWRCVAITRPPATDL